MGAAKINPLSKGQAAVHAPESEANRLRLVNENKGKGAEAPSQAGKSSMLVKENPATRDSLENPSSPQYQKQNKEKVEASKAAPEKKKLGLGPQAPDAPEKHDKKPSNNWEKLLLAQKTLCQKAVNKLAILNGPLNYIKEQKNKLRSRKLRGVMMDIDPEDYFKNKDSVTEK